jgi:large repetitive protein
VTTEGADQSVTGNVTDQAGNTATKTVSGINIDKTAPTITADQSPNANANGWNKTDVTVNYNCADSLSGVDSCSANDNVTTEGTNQSRSGTVTDKAGNTASVTKDGINIDKTAPLVAYQSASPPANAAGWRNVNVTATFEANDQLSGMGETDADKTATNTATTSGEGTNVTVGSPAFTDRAGNTAAANTATSEGFKIDKTVPTLNPSVSPNTVVLNGNALVSANASDPPPGSGLASSSCGAVDTTTVTLNGNPRSVSCTATDVAGNSNTKSASYTVIFGFDVTGAGFLQPINYTAHQTATTAGTDVSTFKGGSTVPVKFVLKDANGNVVQTASAPQWMTPTKGNATNQLVDEPVYTDTPTSGGTYKWDGSQYHYNWGTPKSGAAGFYWRIGVKLEDGQTYFVKISLK